MFFQNGPSGSPTKRDETASEASNRARDGTFRWTAVLFVGLPFLWRGCSLRSLCPSFLFGLTYARLLGRRSFRWNAVSLARLLGPLAGMPLFSSDFCSGGLKTRILVPAWAAEERVKTHSLAFSRHFSLDCRSFRRTAVSLARLLASLAVSFLFVWAYICLRPELFA